MIVGKFAVVDGVLYSARYSTGRGSGVGLVVPGDQPRPEGFTRHERFGWWRDAEWDEVDEAYEIEVWARAPGGWVVQVDEWDEETGQAWVTHMTHVQERSPFGRYEEPAGEPPYLNYRRYDLMSDGWVPGDQLTDVRSVRRDVDLPGRRVS
ncbi:hypothetical protein J1G43_02765 [Cellulomonas sp. zg-ZUI22]|uniref:hypothetical protein n=1 Tax=Cellulomonas sp. zg-ZUI22 TaxID=2816955 RepID=UPI001A94BF93|nr:hypothetical protein [Cellulomonas sp. zg-ZUI22]MBO0898887.1 hypothetical protein [Cellulomonas sp. zg-ZUI22]